MYKGAHLGGAESAYAPPLFCPAHFRRQIRPKSWFAVQIDPKKLGISVCPAQEIRFSHLL